MQPLIQSSSSLSFFETYGLKAEFEIKDAYVEEGTPLFVVSSILPRKERIDNLILELKPYVFKIILGHCYLSMRLIVFAIALITSPP